MDLIGLGTATPERRYTKADCWEAFKLSPWFDRLDRRARIIAELVLQRDNGIEARRLAVDTLQEVFAIDPDTCHARFATHAPALATAAAERALTDSGLRAVEIDAVIVSTCTGYLCPGLSSYVVEKLDLRANAQALDLVGQGCGAALPNWRMADALLKSGSCANVLSVCVEVSSAAMYLDNDPGVLISACLFGDGAGAAVLSAQPRSGRRRVEWKSAASLIDPSERDALRFETQKGLLRNILTRAVPKLAARYAQRVLETVLTEQGLRKSDVNGWIWHAGGRDVMAQLRERIGLSEHDLRHSAAMLREYGNLSSAFVYFALQAALLDDTVGGLWWMGSFGAGFSSHGALLEVA
ncbi:MAG TPA: 3-oxoacyl-[acyl-carrier-protein] synthase III C-terminal domain-containing protein [Xanthomonadaceae bacterium]|jgi:polyketide synthase Type III|nr:3-oxoacyl-[acyl-carrier-protein] synthase III C-terminal domain-containing protein [Xanthomonadaceae bacterium]